MQRFVSDSLVVLHFSRVLKLVGAWGGLCSPQGNAAPPGKHIRGPQKGNILFHHSTSMTWSSEIFFFVFRFFIICRHSLPLPLYPARSPVGYDKSSGASLHFVLVRSVFVPATPGSWSLQGPQPRSHLALRNKKKGKDYGHVFIHKLSTSLHGLLLQGHLFHLVWIWHRWEASWHSIPCECALTGPVTCSPSFDSSLPAAVRDLNAKSQGWPVAQLVEQQIDKPLRLPWRRLSRYHTGTAKNEHRSLARVAGPSYAASGKTWEKRKGHCYGCVMSFLLKIIRWRVPNVCAAGKLMLRCSGTLTLDDSCKQIRPHQWWYAASQLPCYHGSAAELPQVWLHTSVQNVLRLSGTLFGQLRSPRLLGWCWGHGAPFQHSPDLLHHCEQIRICSLAAFQILHIKPYTQYAYLSLSMV